MELIELNYLNSNNSYTNLGQTVQAQVGSYIGNGQSYAGNFVDLITLNFVPDLIVFPFFSLIIAPRFFNGGISVDYNTWSYYSNDLIGITPEQYVFNFNGNVLQIKTQDINKYNLQFSDNYKRVAIGNSLLFNQKGFPYDIIAIKL